jgi:hypothetical protein
LLFLFLPIPNALYRAPERSLGQYNQSPARSVALALCPFIGTITTIAAGLPKL